ncbi:MAG: PDZ domain-containing protein [Planctomycetota bacterium]|nr:MAG: PDZ domain-containing protein [Planctomycetota bacterium]REK24260.1 MAG: PDZ domain-containing protein [Planctomycetota bacterium]REK28755.1 MAG: PDZ domain-containing protein [Planctomycetota bacterium]
MLRSTRNRFSFFRNIAASLACGLLLSAGASAQEAALNGSQLTSGESVRGAFVDVVHNAHVGTVRILIDGEPAALGTVVETDGWIITKGSQLTGEFTCRLADGREVEATYFSYHEESDLALLKVEAADLTPVEWLSETSPEVGQWLATPGLDAAPVGVGIVSVPQREIPLRRLSGVLGVRLADEDGAARIEEVIQDSAAAIARLQPGDRIVQVQEDPIDSRESLVRMIRSFEPGTRLELKVIRGDEEMLISATLTHPFGQFLSRIAAQNHMGGELSGRRTGFPTAFQHDTVLCPEDCGGPVVNLDGQVVGINIARAGRTESYALPAQFVLSLLPELKAGTHPAPEWVATGNVDKTRKEDSLPPAPPAAEPVAQ